MNPNFDTIGKQFVEQYYLVFDNKDIRGQVAAMYHPSDALLTFEGQQFQGLEAIAEKMKTIPIDNMFRQITTIDCQPTIDGGVLVNVIGQLKSESVCLYGEEPPFCTPISQTWDNGYSSKPQILYDITLTLDNRMSSSDIQDFTLEFTASEHKQADPYM